MFCPHCGHKLQSDDQKFCDSCGCDLSKAGMSEPTESKEMIDSTLKGQLSDSKNRSEAKESIGTSSTKTQPNAPSFPTREKAPVRGATSPGTRTQPRRRGRKQLSEHELLIQAQKLKAVEAKAQREKYLLIGAALLLTIGPFCCVGLTGGWMPEGHSPESSTFSGLGNLLYFLLIFASVAAGIVLFMIWFAMYTKAGATQATSIGSGSVTCPYCQSKISPVLRKQGGAIKSFVKGSIFLPWGIKEIQKKDAFYCPKCRMKISEA